MEERSEALLIFIFISDLKKTVSLQRKKKKKERVENKREWNGDLNGGCLLWV